MCTEGSQCLFSSCFQHTYTHTHAGWMGFFFLISTQTELAYINITPRMSILLVIYKVNFLWPRVVPHRLITSFSWTSRDENWLWIVLLCCDKPHNQKKLGEEKVYFILQIEVHHWEKPRQEFKTGTWRPELMQRPWEVLLSDLFPSTCSACFRK